LIGKRLRARPGGEGARRGLFGGRLLFGGGDDAKAEGLTGGDVEGFLVLDVGERLDAGAICPKDLCGMLVELA
jgi:hypothetical protein